MPHFFTPGVPAPQGSKRLLAHGAVVESSREVGPWRERVALQAASVTGTPTEAQVRVELGFLFPRPLSHLRVDGGLRAHAPWRPRRPDLDKLVRAVLDALTGVVYKDDGQVVELVASKRYDASPGVDVIWREVLP